jgi:hypothetical protein
MLVDLCDGFQIDDQLLEVRDEYRICCVECNNYVKISNPSSKIIHSRRCESEPQITEIPKAKPQIKARLKVVAASVLRGGNEDFDDIVAATTAGYLSPSEAMNSDF